MKFLQKMLQFFNFNLSLGKRDVMAQWRVATFVTDILPTCDELHQIMKEGLINKEEHIMIKCLIEIQDKYWTENQGPKELAKLNHAAKHFYRKILRKQKDM